MNDVPSYSSLRIEHLRLKLPFQRFAIDQECPASQPTPLFLIILPLRPKFERIRPYFFLRHPLAELPTTGPASLSPFASLLVQQVGPVKLRDKGPFFLIGRFANSSVAMMPAIHLLVQRPGEG